MILQIFARAPKRFLLLLHEIVSNSWEKRIRTCYLETHNKYYQHKKKCFFCERNCIYIYIVYSFRVYTGRERERGIDIDWYNIQVAPTVDLFPFQRDCCCKNHEICCSCLCHLHDEIISAPCNRGTQLRIVIWTLNYSILLKYCFWTDSLPFGLHRAISLPSLFTCVIVSVDVFFLFNCSTIYITQSGTCEQPPRFLLEANRQVLWKPAHSRNAWVLIESTATTTTKHTMFITINFSWKSQACGLVIARWAWLRRSAHIEPGSTVLGSGNALECSSCRIWFKNHNSSFAVTPAWAKLWTVAPSLRPKTCDRQCKVTWKVTFLWRSKQHRNTTPAPKLGTCTLPMSPASWTLYALPSPPAAQHALSPKTSTDQCGRGIFPKCCELNCDQQ